MVVIWCAVMVSPKLVVDGVSKKFTSNGQVIWAVRDVSFTVAPGEFLCLVGPSGCGKTTLLKIIAALESPTTGKASMDNVPPEVQRDRIGFVFQGFTLFPWRTIIENILLGLEIKGGPRDQRLKRGRELLELVGLDEFAHYYPNQLSGGMQKLAAIARALATDPEILLCDEPFVNIDAQSRNLMQEELLRIWQATKKTIVFVTHNVDEAVFLGNRVLVLTARPARIKERYSVSLGYPRSRTDAELVRIRQQILDDLREEVTL
jgi:NitT/TauT family transport system ATP-binding protein